MVIWQIKLTSNCCRQLSSKGLQPTLSPKNKKKRNGFPNFIRNSWPLPRLSFMMLKISACIPVLRMVFFWGVNMWRTFVMHDYPNMIIYLFIYFAKISCGDLPTGFERELYPLGVPLSQKALSMLWCVSWDKIPSNLNTLMSFNF